MSKIQLIRDSNHVRAMIALSLLATFNLSTADPVTVLNLPASGTAPELIDFDKLPKLSGDHAVTNQVEKSPDFQTGNEPDAPES